MFVVITLILSLLLCLFIVRILYVFTKEYRVEVNNGYHDSEILFNEFKRSDNAKKYKRTKIVFKIINYFIFFLMSLILVLGLCDKFLGILDYHPIVIATGSMSCKNAENTYLIDNNLNNQIQVNDLIIVQKADSIEDIKLYDVICYRNEDNVQIIHRVVSINDGIIKCRGDANNETDKMDITFDRVVGVYHNFRIPKIGNIIFFVTSYYGMITSGAVIFLLFMYTNFKDKSDDEEKRRLKYIKDNYLNNNLKTYVLTSKYGKLEVNDSNYSFNSIEDDNEDSIVMSSLIINGTTKTIERTIQEGEDTHEK